MYMYMFMYMYISWVLFRHKLQIKLISYDIVMFTSIAAPDVTTINDNFRVERVDLQSLTVDLFFPVRRL